MSADMYQHMHITKKENSNISQLQEPWTEWDSADKIVLSASAPPVLTFPVYRIGGLDVKQELNRIVLRVLYSSKKF